MSLSWISHGIIANAIRLGQICQACSDKTHRMSTIMKAAIWLVAQEKCYIVLPGMSSYRRGHPSDSQLFSSYVYCILYPAKKNNNYIFSPQICPSSTARQEASSRCLSTKNTEIQMQIRELTYNKHKYMVMIGWDNDITMQMR